MEGAGGTASLRKAAAHWSLAGDKQLLDLLQSLHERIVNKCQEANTSLEEMVNTLDTASISLQNVNNRLMALSNSQFVESRVYDDDVDVATAETPVKEPPKPSEPTSELTKLRDSLRVLEAYHEPVHILDSDSDTVSDEEEEDRLVLKPKDLYADRPLPYIIGSQNWRSKWHAGLVAEDSDTDSDTWKANPPSEQYSDSEPDGMDRPTDKPHASQQTISTTSSIGSELTIPTAGKPADIAAELARRLGGAGPQVQIPDPEPDSAPTKAAPAKVIRPQQPVTATIFSDSPPPLDTDQPEQSDQTDSEDDVFAELHKSTARKPGPSAIGRGDVVDQLFGNVSQYGRKGDLDEHVDKSQPNNSSKQPSPLFEKTQDSELFTDKTKSGQRSIHAEVQPENSVRKPVGGISLFGNNQGAESIGAAILKRNQRKVSTSDEEIEEPQQISKNKNYTENVTVRTGPSNAKDDIQKSIINDLFSKPNKSNQSYKKVEKISKEMERPVNKKVDLFTDDLFDDIDDIFTNFKPIVKESTESLKKSLFDDDGDDLFANVGVSSNETSTKLESKSKSIFGTDDDLFSEQNEENNVQKLNIGTKSNKVPQDYSDKDNEESNNIYTVGVNTVIETATIVKKSEYESNLTDITDSEVKAVQGKTLIKSNIKSIFDSESDDDIFSDHKTSSKEISNTRNNKDSIIYNVANKVESHSTMDENALFLPKDLPENKTDSWSVSHDIIKTKKESDEFVEDGPLCKYIEKPIGTEEFLTKRIKSNDSRNEVSKEEFEDNNKKTDEVLTESIESSSEIENNTSVYNENKLNAGSNRNENKELSSNISNNIIPETQFRSPSLFEENDDLDDMFTKNPDSNNTKEIHNEIVTTNTNSNILSDITFDKDIDSSSKILHAKNSNEPNIDTINKSNMNIDSNNSKNVTQIINEKLVVKNDTNISSKMIESVNSKDLPQDTDEIPKSDWLQGVELLRDDSFDYSISTPEEAVREETKKLKTEYNNIPSDFIQKEPIFSESTVSSEPDIFNDIFSDIPPEFERQTEPKKSKNVNALFDDDSDDEALFFKKNEIVTDEKPDVDFSFQDENLFHIFHDEPPAIDVDFTQKPKKIVSSDVETVSDEIYSEINPSNTNIDGMQISCIKEETNKQPSTFLESEIEKSIDEAKKPVGKLKPMSFNINVSTLLPGASPKKTKCYEQIDGQSIATKSRENVATDIDSQVVKSVSFEGDPESEVLDNKLSKGRAKIQVKRRPSSRRARKEAVRKSGIDFGDDSTDNSSSADISKKERVDDLDSNKNTNQYKHHLDTTKQENLIVDKVIITDVENRYNSSNTHANDVIKSISNVSVENNIEYNIEHVETNIAEYMEDSHNSPNSVRKIKISENSSLTSFNKNPDVKSKVVYILNDEDIFTNTKTVINTTENIDKVPEFNINVDQNKYLNIEDDDEELFTASTSKNKNISNLGNVYKNDNLKNHGIDNFDSDEDIFKASQSKSITNVPLNTKSKDNKGEIDKIEAKIDKLFVKTHSVKVKGSLFEGLSDDESELFGSKKSMKNSVTSDKGDGLSTIIKKEVQLPRKDVKVSLFGNESDDDDLFGVKGTKKETSRPASKPKEVPSKATEPVFDDPLSLLGQEDDM